MSVTRRAFAAAAPFVPALLGQRVRRPNIVLAVADDLTWFHTEPYGSKQVRTPALRQFAQEGVCLDAMFTGTAMCAPTRQQLYTGLYPVRNGAFPNHSRVYDGVRTLPVYFRELGYRVGLAGKQHFGPPEAYPFELVGKRGSDPDPDDLSAVYEFMRRDEKQPFVLVFASHQPHMPWDRGDASAYAPERLAVPPDLADCPETRAALSRYFAEVTWFDRQVGALLRAIDKANCRENTAVIVTSEQGGQFPFSKWTCYDAGLRTAFMVRWPGVVKAGTRTAAMTHYVDVLPTLIEAAGGQPANAKTGRPDTRGYAGFDGESFLAVLQGRKDKHRDHVFGVQTTRGIIQGSDCYPVRSVRTNRYKYIRNLNSESAFRNIATEQKDGLIQAWLALGGDAAKRARAYMHRPAEELYDMLADPHELRNLASDGALRPVIADLDGRLQAWMRQQGDAGIETEMQARQRQMRGVE